MSFKDKVVIITGAGTGIGAATAIQFAKEGANIAIVGRRENKLKETAEKCNAIGKDVLIIVADVSKEEDAIRIVDTTINKYGKLDVLVNNAGISKQGSICQGDLLDAYDVTMNINLRAVIHLTALATPHLKKTKGNVINISSAVTEKVTGGTTFFTYSVSKAALNQFMKQAASELGLYQIRVNNVSPGPTKTDFFVNCDIQYKFENMDTMTALNKVSQSEEVADVILFLASDKAGSITGSNYIIDCGYLVKS